MPGAMGGSVKNQACKSTTRHGRAGVSGRLLLIGAVGEEYHVRVEAGRALRREGGGPALAERVHRLGEAESRVVQHGAERRVVCWTWARPRPSAGR